LQNNSDRNRRNQRFVDSISSVPGPLAAVSFSVRMLQSSKPESRQQVEFIRIRMRP
jgi:hypothetical protein